MIQDLPFFIVVAIGMVLRLPLVGAEQTYSCGAEGKLRLHLKVKIEEKSLPHIV